jgi:hypothetical protein
VPIGAGILLAYNGNQPVYRYKNQTLSATAFENSSQTLLRYSESLQPMSTSMDKALEQAIAFILRHRYAKAAQLHLLREVGEVLANKLL